MSGALKFDSIKGVLCGSEGLNQRQRTFLEDVFNAKVYSWYGQTEKVVLGGECEYSHDYHLFSEYGYTELVDEQGRVINEPNRTGEIIGSGFINYAMPLIRYRTGDYGAYTEGKCRCGRSYRRLKEIAGRRSSEYLICDDGEHFPFSSLDLQLQIFQDIAQWQFVQEKQGEVKVKIMAYNQNMEIDKRRIERELSIQCDLKIRFHADIASDLETTPRGKIQTFIQKIKNDAQYNS